MKEKKLEAETVREEILRSVRELKEIRPLLQDGLEEGPAEGLRSVPHHGHPLAVLVQDPLPGPGHPSTPWKAKPRSAR